MKKTMVCLLACLLLVGALCPVRSYADTTYSGKMFTDRSALAEKLDEIFAGQLDLYYDAGCTSRVNAPLGSYAVPNNGVILYAGAYNGRAVNSGTSCWIYAKAVYHTLFSDEEGNGDPGLNSISLDLSCTAKKQVTYENFLSWGVRNEPGALVRCGTHSFIILGYNEEKITLLEGNAYGHGEVQLTILTWQEAAKRSNYNGWVEYIIQPKDEYFEKKFSYVNDCTFYFSSGEIEIKKDTNMKSLPCSMATRKKSATLQKCTPGMKFEVCGMYRNTAGNFWYRIPLKDGFYGYIYGGDAKFTTASIGSSYAQSYFTLTGADLWWMNGKTCEKVGWVDAPATRTCPV